MDKKSELITRALERQQEGDLEGAERLFSSALRLDPKNPNLLFLMGALHTLWGNDESAVLYFDEALEVRPEWVEAAVSCGQACLRLERFHNALDRFRAARAAGGDGPELLLGMGMAHLAVDEVDAAIEWFRLQIEAEPDDAEALQLLANAQRAAGDAEGSAATYRRAAAADPSDPANQFHLADALIAGGHLDQAVEPLRRAIELAPDAPEPRVQLSAVLRGLQRYDEASDDMRNLTELNAENLDAWMELGLALYGKKELSDSEQALRVVWRRFPTDPRVNVALGDTLMASDKLTDAETCFKRAIETEATNLEAHLKLAENYSRMCDHNRAAETLDDAIAFWPLIPEPYELLGAALSKAGRTVEAEYVLGEGLKRFPDRVGLRSNLSQISRMNERTSPGARHTNSILPMSCVQRLRRFLGECLKLTLTGDAIECGTYRGGAATDLARVLAETKKRVHAVDTFAGIPAPGPEDAGLSVGDYSDTSLDRVRASWSSLGVAERIEAHAGLFQDLFPAMIRHRYCLALVDAKLYASTVQALEHVYPRLSRYGWLFVNDYGATYAPGVKLALDQFLADKPERTAVIHISDNLFGFKKE